MGCGRWSGPSGAYESLIAHSVPIDIISRVVIENENLVLSVPLDWRGRVMGLGSCVIVRTPMCVARQGVRVRASQHIIPSNCFSSSSSAQTAHSSLTAPAALHRLPVFCSKRTSNEDDQLSPEEEADKDNSHDDMTDHQQQTYISSVTTVAFWVPKPHPFTFIINNNSIHFLSSIIIFLFIHLWLVFFSCSSALRSHLVSAWVIKRVLARQLNSLLGMHTNPTQPNSIFK